MLALVWTLPVQKALLLVGLFWAHGRALQRADVLTLIPETAVATLVSGRHPDFVGIGAKLPLFHQEMGWSPVVATQKTESSLLRARSNRTYQHHSKPNGHDAACAGDPARCASPIHASVSDGGACLVQFVGSSVGVVG